MARRVPPLKSLRAFEAAGRHLSFTRAADELFVTQAAISHQIKALEEYLGLPLFIRRNRKLLLTDEGQNYWPKIRNMFESLTLATDQLKSQIAGGPLTVSVVPTFATSWLIPRLSDFNKTYPEIEVRLKASDDSADFLQEDVDLAIYYEIAEYPGLYSVRLLAEQLTPLCSPSFLDGNLPLNTPEDLRKHNLLHDDSTNDWTQWLQLAGVEGIDLTHGAVFSHSNMVQQAAIFGQGIAMGHLVLSQAEVSAGRLVQPFELMMESELSYDLVCPLEYAERPKIRAFIDWITETIAREY